MARLIRNRVLTIGLSVLVTALPAIAEEPPVKYPPPCDPSQVTKSDVDRAHSVFLSGRQYLEESNYDKAIGYFIDAYAIDCSIHAILPIIATAYERKGDRAEAIRALEEYVKRAPDAADHEVIERRIKNLREQLARETSAAPTAVPTAAPSASVPPAAPPAPPPESSAAPVPSASSASPTPPPTAPGLPSRANEPHSALPWVAVGVGGAAVAAGIALYAVGAGDVSSASSNPNCNSARMCTLQTLVTKGNDGRTLETVGGVVGGVGLALTAAGLIWHFVEKPGPAGASGAIRPVVAPGYAGIGAVGEF